LQSVNADPGSADRRTLLITLNDGLDAGIAIETLVRALTDAGIGIHALIPEQASLEQIFSELTAHEKKTTGVAEPGAES